jgi:anthranilate phosphoribosyltransferase
MSIANPRVLLGLDLHVLALVIRPGVLGRGDGDLRCGGDPAQNAAVILTVFDGERGPRRDAVILNAAAALLVGGVVDDWEAGIDRAVDTIDSGAAQSKLDELIAFTRARGPAA